MSDVGSGGGADSEGAGICAESLLERHMEMGTIGETPTGGVDRAALNDADTDAHALVMSWFRQPHYRIEVDDVGNLFIIRAGQDPNAGAVMTGSHLDTPPNGGRFDGALGVLAGAEVLASLDRQGIVTRRPIELAIWMNEEGSRFSPVTMGSAVRIGRLGLDEALNSVDENGAVFGPQLQRYFEKLGLEPMPGSRRDPAFYVELHIEQGPILENRGVRIGTVSGVQGVRQYRIDVAGKAAHAGTTPMDMRKDAFVAACRIAAGLSAEFTHDDERTRFTIGRMRVLPGAPNTVPEKASFTVDLRHPDPRQLAEYDAKISTVAAREASPCAVAVEPLISLEPVVFNPGICDLIAGSARRRGLSVETLLSGATHDAANMATVTKTGMIFIPCRDGVSHHEDEHAEPADMIAGANVLFDVILALAEKADSHAAIAAPALI